MIALHEFKYTSCMSDKAVLDEWFENPYESIYLPVRLILNMNIRVIR